MTTQMFYRLAAKDPNGKPVRCKVSSIEIANERKAEWENLGYTEIEVREYLQVWDNYSYGSFSLI